MNFIKRFFTGFCIIILFFGLVLFSPAIVIHTIIYDSEFMITTMSSIDLTPFIEKTMQEEFGAELPKEVRRDFAEKIHVLAKKELEGIIHPLYDYLLGKSESLDLVISLERLKKELKPVLFDYLLKSQPDELRNKMKKEYESFWEKTTSRFPDTIDVRRTLEQNNALESIVLARKAITILGWSIYIAVIVLALCMAAIILMQKQPRRFFLIFGAVFIPAGMIHFISGIIFLLSGQSLFTAWQMPEFTTVPVFNLLGIVFEKIRIAGIISMSAGVLCTGLSIFLKGY